MGLLKPLIVAIITLFILDLIFPNVSFSNWVVIIIAGIVLTLVQSIVKPVLSLLLLPLNVITFGLFATILNIALLWAITAVVPGFHIDPVTILGYRLNYFMTLVLFSFLISFVQSVIRKGIIRS